MGENVAKGNVHPVNTFSSALYTCHLPPESPKLYALPPFQAHRQIPKATTIPTGKTHMLSSLCRRDEGKKVRKTFINFSLSKSNSFP